MNIVRSFQCEPVSTLTTRSPRMPHFTPDRLACVVLLTGFCCADQRKVSIKTIQLPQRSNYNTYKEFFTFALNCDSYMCVCFCTIMFGCLIKRDHLDLPVCETLLSLLSACLP